MGSFLLLFHSNLSCEWVKVFFKLLSWCMIERKEHKMLNLIYFFLPVLRSSSGKREAFRRSPGLTSRASAILHRISREKGRTIFGASIELICERFTLAFSASFSCDTARIFRMAAIVISNCINLSLFLNFISLLISVALPFQRIIAQLYFLSYPMFDAIKKHLTYILSKYIIYEETYSSERG